MAARDENIEALAYEIGKIYINRQPRNSTIVADLIDTGDREKIAERAIEFLSRLEAGSGEETGVTPVLSVRMSATKEELLAALNQEGGDADEPRRIEPHVATPAPGENSGRAEARARWDLMATELLDGLTHERVGDLVIDDAVDARATIYDALNIAYEAGEKAGRRSGLEEAAKVADAMSYYADNSQDFDDACDKIAAAIRAIPEKQS